ncbi:MAG: response regulator [Actinomycetaceae bacterium]|nr:response regulator [Actinomycetaceae bacterium]MDY6083211.1 response regulator [Actinomycetaceae bacterium]
MAVEESQAAGSTGVDGEDVKIRALVVEDDPIIRLDLVETLEDAGYEVVGQAENGEVGLRLADEYSPDLIIMDIKMPTMDGLTAARAILENQRVAIVMLTAFSDSDFVAQARDAGVMGYVVKPFTPATLLPSVEIAISRFEEMTSLEDEVSNLQQRFETRKLVDRAKGLLESEMGLTEPEAFRWIQKTSMNRRLTMREVAEAVIDQIQ